MGSHPARVEQGPVLSSGRRLAMGFAFVALWFCLSLLIFAGIGRDLRTLAKLRARGRATTGVVSGLHPERPASVSVEFEADGHSRSVESPFVGKPNPRLEALHVGQSVELWYLPEEPDVASVGNPQALMRRNTSLPVSLALGLVLNPLVFWVWAAFRRRLRSESR